MMLSNLQTGSLDFLSRELQESFICLLSYCKPVKLNYDTSCLFNPIIRNPLLLWANYLR